MATYMHIVHRDISADEGPVVLSVWAQLDNANEAAAEAFRHAVSLPEGANLEKYLTVHEEDDTWELYYAEGEEEAGMRVFVRTFPVSDFGDDFDEEPAKADYPPPEDEDDEGAPAGAEFEEEEEDDEDEDEEEAEEAPGQGLKRKKM